MSDELQENVREALNIIEARKQAEQVLQKIADADEQADLEFTPFSINNRVVTEPYKTDKAIRAQVSGGLARPEQKTALKGLRVLLDAVVQQGHSSILIEKGQVVYIREELLHTQKWATTALSSDLVGEPFIIVDFNFVEFIAKK